MAGNKLIVERLASFIQRLLSTRPRQITSGVVVAVALFLVRNLSRRNVPKVDAPKQPSNANRGSVDKQFLRNCYNLAKIAIPGVWTNEAWHLLCCTVVLCVRTKLSVELAVNNGLIVRAIVSQDWKKYLWHLGLLATFAIPSSLCNSGLEYYQKKLAMLYRERLSAYFNKEYLSGLTYYQVVHVDDRVPNPDQRLTQDIEKFSQSLSGLYLNIAKPLVDMVLFSKELAKQVGWIGSWSGLFYYVIASNIIRMISPAFSKLTVKEQELEGDYRSCQSDLINYSEEITFYRGSEWERRRCARTYSSLSSHIQNTIMKRFIMGIFDNILIRYGSHIYAIGMLGIPVFGPNAGDYVKTTGQASIMQDYIKNFSLLVNLGKAAGRMLYSYKDIQHLAGFTHLTTKMKQVLQELKNGKHSRQLVDSSELNVDQRGTIQSPFENIRFHDVDIYSPDGNNLLNDLSFEIKPGMHTFVYGPNGCGKSSFFRVLAELWPLFSGSVDKPHNKDIFYIAQNPYCPKGTFRDQIIYPHTLEEMKSAGVTDADLEKIMISVKLEKVIQREQWDNLKDWQSVLSGGEKQKAAMARLFYHKPKFAILDECTSAVHKDSEGQLYELFKQAGITLITISHREGLLRYHDYILTIDESKNWRFSKVEGLENIQ